jgi:hypothetical protein
VLLIFVVVCVVFCFVCIRPVSNCVSDVPSVSGLSILDCTSVFSNVYF